MSQSKAKADRKAERDKQDDPFIYRRVEYATDHEVVTGITERVPVSGTPPEGFTRFARGFTLSKMEPRIGPFPIKLQFAIQVDADSPAEALVKIIRELKWRKPAEEKELDSRIMKKLLSLDGVPRKLPGGPRGGPAGVVRGPH